MVSFQPAPTLQGGYAADDAKLANQYQKGPLGRGTFSYLDQYDLGSAGKLGVSLILQSQRTSEPGEFALSNSQVLACNADAAFTSGKCPTVSGKDVAGGTPYYLIQSSRTYKAMSNSDHRNSVFGTVQWRLNNSLEFGLDYETSMRNWRENLHELVLGGASEGVTNVNADANGVLHSYSGSSSIKSESNYYTRNERYKGGGLSVKWRPSEAWLVTGDVNYSGTRRLQMETLTELSSLGLDSAGNPLPGTTDDGKDIDYTYNYAGDVPTININPLFNINDPNNFLGTSEVEPEAEQHVDIVRAGRVDVSYFPESGWLTTIKAGARVSDLSYSDFLLQTKTEYKDPALTAQAVSSCQEPFVGSDFLSGASGNTVHSYASFNAKCLFNAFTGSSLATVPADTQSPANDNVNEKTQAAYLMAEFSSNWLNLPVRGNFGVRWVRTADSSVGLSSALSVVNYSDGTVGLTPTGAYTATTVNGSYNTILPSFNAVFNLNDDTLLRFALYRAMARPAPDQLGAGRNITLSSGEGFTNISEAISNVTSTGNPRSKPLLAWNTGLSLEWYPNRDSMLSGSLYFKRFNGATVSTVNNENFDIGGQTMSIPVIEPSTSSQKSDLRGIGLTGTYRFSFLPAPFNGLGVKVGYNYNKSNFKTQDLLLGVVNNPLTGETTPAIVKPLGMYGLSRDVLSSSLYYARGPIDLKAVWTYRSSFFQQFSGVPHQNRLVQGSGQLGFRATWRMTKKFELSLDGENLTNSAQVAYMPIEGNFYSYASWGRKYFIDAKYKF